MVFKKEGKTCKIMIELNPLENGKVERVMKKEQLVSKKATIKNMIRKY